MTYDKKLESLIADAEEMLKRKNFSEASADMLKDEIKRAKDTLLKHGGDEEILKIVYSGEGWAMLEGLKGAVERFLKKEISQSDFGFVKERLDRFLAEKVPGDKTGCVKKAAYERVLKAKERLSNGDIQSIIEACNALYNAYRSVNVRRHDNGSEYIFFSAEQLSKIKEKLSVPALKNEWERIQNTAKKYSLADTENIPKNFKSWRTVRINFKTPENCAFIKPEIMLCGAGCVYIDGLYAEQSGKNELSLENPGFESGTRGWSFFADNGCRAYVKHDESKNRLYCAEGDYSVCLENGVQSGKSAVCADGFSEVNENSPHTLRVMVRQDELINGGVKITVKYYDKGEKTLGSDCYDWNMKTAIRWDYLFETANSDAIVYLLTGETDYAVKAKRELLYMLDDMRDTGVLFWMKYNKMPFDDGYGTVHMGRAMAGICVMYDILRKADGIISPEEDKLLREKIYFIADYLGMRNEYYGEIKDRKHLYSGGNWTTDRYMGLAYFAMTFPEYERSKTYFLNAKIIIDDQLKNWITEEGILPESARYHNAVLEHLTFYALAVKRYDGTDYSKNERFKKMYEYLINTQLPECEYHGGRISRPVFGDDRLGEGEMFVYFNAASKLFRETDPDFADRMLTTWKKGGSRNSFGGLNGWLLEFLLIDIENTPMPEYKVPLKSMWYKNFGLATMRASYRKDNDTALSVVFTKNNTAHGHFDHGSFTFFTGGVPVSLDPCVESYWENSLAWFRSSEAHSTVQFESRQVPMESRPECFDTNEIRDYCRVVIKNPSGCGFHRRHIVLIKPVCAVVIYDEITGFCGSTVFNLPVCSVESEIRENTVLSKGHFGVNLQTVVLLPENPKILKEKGAVAKGCIPSRTQEYIRVPSECGHLTALLPYDDRPHEVIPYKNGYSIDKKVYFEIPDLKEVKFC